MAKKSMIARKNKVASLVKRFAEKRAAIKEDIRTATAIEDAIEAGEKLQKLPVNSSASRLNTRCEQCGRPRGVYRKFKLCRICLRKHLNEGDVTGGRKSSW